MSGPAQKLFAAITHARLPHAVLLTGPQGSDAAHVAREAAALYITGEAASQKLVNCPDYFALGPTPIAVDAVRELQLRIAEQAYSGKRAIIFFEAHTMNPSTQNALLKTLEEPPPNTLLLLCGQEAGLLPTIRSRCAILRFGALAEEEIIARLTQNGVPEEEAAFGAWISEGAPLLAQTLATPAHLDFFRRAATFWAACIASPIPLYDEVAPFLDTPLPGVEVQSQSKAARQRPSGDFLLRCLLALSRDALHILYALPPAAANPATAQVTEAARRFTIAQIQGMIDLMLSARRRLDAANPTMALDWFLTAAARQNCNGPSEKKRNEHTWQNE